MPDIRPEHERVSATQLFTRAGQLVAELRRVGAHGSTERRTARQYANMINEMLRRIRSGDRMTQDEVANLRMQIEDILEIYPGLRIQFEDLLE